MNLYVTLLRGINVGGNNLISMTKLKSCFESQGFHNVSTYIQSGNVLFASKETDQRKLTRRIEEVLSKTFYYKSRVVIRSHKQMKEIVQRAPKRFGDDPAAYRYDVIFLKEPVTSAEALKSVSLKEGVDQVTAGKGVLYFSRLNSKAAQSHLARIVSKPVYKDMTIRNWNTTTRLLQMLDLASHPPII
jgi:uncharacterized protein (DUF1697 family)